MNEPEIGAPVSWIPAAFTSHGDDSAGILGVTVRVNGRIVYINREHRWYRAEARFAGGVIRECFKY